MNFGETIKEARILKKLTQKDLGERVGVDPVYISKIEQGKLPADDKVKLLCKILGLDYQRMIQLKYKEKTGITIEIEKGQVKESGVSYLVRSIYVISYADAGSPAHDYDDSGYPIWDGFDTVPRPADLKDANAYALKVVGDSMKPMLKEGSIIIVSPQAQVLNGDIAVVRDVKDEVKVKVITYRNEQIILGSFNPNYPPEVYKKEEIKFIHKVVQIRF